MIVVRKTTIIIVGFLSLGWLAKAASGGDSAESNSYFRMAASLDQPLATPEYQLSRLGQIESLCTLVKERRVAQGDPAIREAAEKFYGVLFDAAGTSVLERARTQAKLDHEKARLKLLEIKAAAARGEYVKMEPRTSSTSFENNIDRNTGNRIPKVEYVEVDYGDREIRDAKSKADISVDARTLKGLKESLIQVELLKSNFWAKNIPSLPEKFAGPKDEKPLVKVRYGPNGGVPRPGPDGKRQYVIEAVLDDGFYGKHVATNVSGRDLTNVTLLIEYVHFSSFPQTTGRRVHFLSRFEAGESVELARTLPFNANALKSYNDSLVAARGINRTGREKLREVSLDLPGLMGVVRIMTTVWADQASQPSTAFDLHDRADKVGHAVLEFARSGSSLQSKARELIKIAMSKPAEEPAKPSPPAPVPAPPSQFTVRQNRNATRPGSREDAAVVPHPGMGQPRPPEPIHVASGPPESRIAQIEALVRGLDFRNIAERKEAKQAAIDALVRAGEEVKEGRSTAKDMAEASKKLEWLASLDLTNPFNINRIKSALELIKLFENSPK